MWLFCCWLLSLCSFGYFFIKQKTRIAIVTIIKERMQERLLNIYFVILNMIKLVLTHLLVFVITIFKKKTSKDPCSHKNIYQCAWQSVYCIYIYIYFKTNQIQNLFFTDFRPYKESLQQKVLLRESVEN